uniref:Putative secreted protein n=1 Tax=Aedes albopictus TaxID=7160 RepID=A0A023ECJ3_AEDAL
MKIPSVLGMVRQFMFVVLVCCLLVSAAPVQEEDEGTLSRIEWEPSTTTYKYQEFINAYTRSPFVPKTSPTTTTTTTTTTPAPVTEKPKKWYQFWRS